MGASKVLLASSLRVRPRVSAVCIRSGGPVRSRGQNRRSAQRTKARIECICLILMDSWSTTLSPLQGTEKLFWTLL